MTTVKVEVLNAVVGGKKQGEQIEINSRSASYFASIGYVKIIEEIKPKKQAIEDPKKETKKTKKG